MNRHKMAGYAFRLCSVSYGGRVGSNPPYGTCPEEQPKLLVPDERPNCLATRSNRVSSVTESSTSMAGRPALLVFFLRRSVNSPSRTSRFCSACLQRYSMASLDFRTRPDGIPVSEGAKRFGQSRKAGVSLDQAATGRPRRPPGGRAGTPGDPRQSDRSIHPERSEGVEHGLRKPVQPPLVHVHLIKSAGEWALLRWGPAAVVAYCFVRGVVPQTILIRQALGDRRLAGAAAATNPVNVPQP
jgi:hypothetical protein